MNRTERERRAFHWRENGAYVIRSAESRTALGREREFGAGGDE